MEPCHVRGAQHPTRNRDGIGQYGPRRPKKVKRFWRGSTKAGVGSDLRRKCTL